MSVRGSAQKRASLPRTTCSEPGATAYSHLSPGTFRSRSAKGKSRISPINGPAGCSPARPDCANFLHPANLTNHRVRTSSSLSDGSLPDTCRLRYPPGSAQLGGERKFGEWRGPAHRVHPDECSIKSRPAHARGWDGPPLVALSGPRWRDRDGIIARLSDILFTILLG